MGAPGPGQRLPLRRELRGGRPGAGSGAVQEAEAERNGVAIRREWHIMPWAFKLGHLRPAQSLLLPILFKFTPFHTGEPKGKFFQPRK